MLMPQFGNIPGLPTGSRPFAPPLTPQQLMQAGMDPRAYYGEQTAAAGATPVGAPKPPEPGAAQRIREGLQGAAARGQQFLNTFMQGAAPAATPEPEIAGRTRRLGAAAGMIAPVMEAVGEAQAGRPVGALGAIGGGAAGVGLGAAAALMLPGRYGKIAGAILPAVGGLLGAPTGASAAESIRQKVTGEPTKGKEGEFSTQKVIAEQINELGTTQYRDQMGVYTSALKDLSKHYSDQQYYELRRNMPLIERMQNSELVRQQALNAHMAQQQAMLGTLATGGALAQGAQAESGATLRTALTSAPYAGSVLQAPQIRFG
jgi:hypothetical protein